MDEDNGAETAEGCETETDDDGDGTVEEKGDEGDETSMVQGSGSTPAWERPWWAKRDPGPDRGEDIGSETEEIVDADQGLAEGIVDAGPAQGQGQDHTPKAQARLGREERGQRVPTMRAL